MCLHFIHKKRVFQLLEDYVNTMNIKYDIVISLRVDVEINNTFSFHISNNTIYIPYGYDYVKNAINDQIAYGSYDVMKKYNNIYDNLLDLLNLRLSIPHPESLTYANIKYHNIQVKRFHLDYCLVKNRQS